MRPSLRRVDRKRVSGVAVDVAAFDDRRPPRLFRQLLDRRVAIRVSGLDRDLRRKVAGEPRGVDHHAAYHPGHTQPDALRIADFAGDAAAPPAVPPVVDLAPLP